MNYTYLKKKHKNLSALLQREIKRQQQVINLIPSENYASPAVLEALATIFSDKYAEGKPKQRYYFGNENVDTLESLTQELVLKMFGLTSRLWAANVQPYSGSPANLAVYAGLLKPGDTVLAMSLDQGGHLTHGHSVSFTSKVWNFVHYGVADDGRIDYDEVARLAKKHKPKLIVCGGTAIPRTIDFKKLSAIARRNRCYFMADISHIAGLVVGGAHASPFPYADVVMTTTHKTLRGPRAAMIISKRAVSEAIDKAIFPGLQGGPHVNTILAMAVMAQEALQPGFKKYARQVVKNAKALAVELDRLGFNIVSGGTDNHLLLVDVTPLGMSGKQAGELLEAAGVIVNKNTIPGDRRKPWDPSGIRLGTPAVTTRGMREKEMKLVAQIIASVLKDRALVHQVQPYVQKLTKQFPIHDH